MYLLNEVWKKDYKDNGFLIVCILSYGYLNMVMGVCSEDFGIDEIMILFCVDCCLSLLGKFKFFIF